MKTFEEKYTAWLDGTLTGEPLQSFENEHPSIQPEKTDYLKLKNLLRENLPGRELENAEFFASQIMEQIKRETAAGRKSSGRRWFGVPRLAWGGIGALGIGFALFFTSYSTFLTRPGIYLEDLFVLESHRRQGVGRALLVEVQRIAGARGAGRLEWAVLEWNADAIEFYRRIGAEVMPDWRLCRVRLP